MLTFIQHLSHLFLTWEFQKPIKNCQKLSLFPEAWSYVAFWGLVIKQVISAPLSFGETALQLQMSGLEGNKAGSSQQFSEQSKQTSSVGIVLGELLRFWGPILSPIVPHQVEMRNPVHFWFPSEKVVHLWKVPALLVRLWNRQTDFQIHVLRHIWGPLWVTHFLFTWRLGETLGAWDDAGT